MQSLQFCWFQTFLLYKINIICFFYTIIGRVKSFEDYWINLKSYYWSINWKLLLGLWIKTKRAGFWASFIHSILSFNTVIWLLFHTVIFSGIHSHSQSSTVIFLYGHSLHGRLLNYSTTQHENFNLLHWCVIIVQ